MKNGIADMNKRRGRIQNLSFVWMDRALILKPGPWNALSPSARIIYQMLKAKYNRSNNGILTLHHSEVHRAKVKGLSSPKGISAAFKELIESEFIIAEKTIGGLHRFTVLYRLTFKVDKLD
jgi:hypothetical protein